MSEPLYRLEGVGKDYQGQAETLTILKSVDLEINPGDSLAVVGASGSGKSTLLHIMGTLDTSTQGRVRFDGRDLQGLGQTDRARIRNREIGFVFQFHHLLSEFSTEENVAMPGIIGGMARAKALKRARDLLALVGLEGRISHRVNTLSGGERQRVAIARSVFMDPKVLLADEPTGNLDEATGARVAELLVRLNRELSMALVVVTHNRELAARMNRHLELHAGELHEVTIRPDLVH
ncbi:MAG: ABC transporter ATP-binding protein [Deltaproteobacteria bacterium]|nr:ABC transporter ATP-binding protein [Deltaproteobacteria bacterium]